MSDQATDVCLLFWIPHKTRNYEHMAEVMLAARVITVLTKSVIETND